MIRDEILRVLNKQLVYLDESNGSDALAIDVGRALQATLRDYKGDGSNRALLRELVHLHDLLLTCRPRMANILLDVQRCILFVANNPEVQSKELIPFVDERLNSKVQRRSELAQRATTLFQSESTILVHSHSGLLAYLLGQANESPKRPTVVVAAQAPNKTNKIIEALSEQKLSYTVVSEFAVSHVLPQINFGLFGALTLDQDQVVMGPGSAGLISQLHAAQIPAYVVLTSNKFGFWGDQVAPAFREVRPKKLKNFTFEKVVFSHDTVPISLVTGFVTEKGVLNQEETMSLYREMHREFDDRELEIGKIRETLGESLPNQESAGDNLINLGA